MCVSADFVCGGHVQDVLDSIIYAHDSDGMLVHAISRVSVCVTVCPYKGEPLRPNRFLI